VRADISYAVSEADPRLRFADATAFEAWLAGHASASAGVWLELGRKDSGVQTITYDEAIEAALRVGWIDGQKRGGDGDVWLQRFSPRTRTSRWSKINRAKAEALIAAGRMEQGGLAAVEAARADGRWERAYAGARTIEVPADLRAALDDNLTAAAFFETLDRANRYAVLYRVHDAKRPETRARRIAQFVEMLARGETLHPPRRRDS
jgi:uncharacterized protein YdeI (YjbR/CyaY-like superfamily)